MGKQATRDHFRMPLYGVITEDTLTTGCPFIVNEAGTTGSSHSVTAAGVNLILDATDEAQNEMLSMGDILHYDIDDLIRVEFLATITTASAVGITASFGLASAANVDEDALAANALFKVEGSLAVVVETDDGTTNTDDVATGQTLVTAVERRFAIDFSRDVQTVAPPGTSKAGKGNVHFYMDDVNGYLKRVGQASLMDMSAYTAGLQIYGMIGKASGATLGTLTIKDVKVEHKLY